MVQSCFLCNGEIQENNFSNSDDNFILLGQILEIPNLKNNVTTFKDIDYCPGCLERIFSIRDMLEDLEKLEKRILDEKYLIENQLKENSRRSNEKTITQKRNSPTNELTIKVGAELTAKTIQSMLKKIRNKRVGRTVKPQRPVRIMKNITIPKNSTPESGKVGHNYENHPQLQRPASARERVIFTYQSPINIHESLPMENNLEIQSSSGAGVLQDPLQVNTRQAIWTASDIDLDIKYERNSYLMDVCDDFHVDNIVASSEFTADAPTDLDSNFAKSEIGDDEQVGLTKFSDVQVTAERNTKMYICGICGASFDRYNQLLIHDRVHIKTGISYVVSKSKRTDVTPSKNNHPSSKNRKRRQNHKVCPSDRARKCDECGRILSTHSHWRHHIMQVHRKEHRFKCPFCDFGCQQNSELERHKLIHSDERSFKCHLCHRAFKQKRGLTGHLKCHK